MEDENVLDDLPLERPFTVESVEAAVAMANAVRYIELNHPDLVKDEKLLQLLYQLLRQQMIETKAIILSEELNEKLMERFEIVDEVSHKNDSQFAKCTAIEPPTETSP